MFKWDTTHYLTQLATPNGFSQGMPNGKTEDWVAWRMAGLVTGCVPRYQTYVIIQINKPADAATELAIL
jgi:hypothetical protein